LCHACKMCHHNAQGCICSWRNTSVVKGINRYVKNLFVMSKKRMIQ
jgi:hypothetical protein